MKKIYTQPRIETVATTPQLILCASGGIKAQISGYGTKASGSGFTQTFVWLAGAVCSSLLFLGTACSTNNPDQPKQQAELKPRTLIVTQQAVSRQHSAVRRLPQATITDEGTTLDALWEINDTVFFRNLSRNEYHDEETDSYPDLFGTLNADKAERIASFTGDRVWCTEDDQLALIYPALDVENHPELFTFHESPLSAEYTISVAGQNGTLAKLAKDFHHIYGIASVVSVTETTANAELAEMKSLLTVCKFSFVDEKVPGTSLPISTLKISVSDSYFAGTYPQQGTVSIAQSTPAWNVSVDPEWKTTAAGGKPLTITTPTGTTPTEVYVALFPQLELSYTFTVTNSDGTYTGTAKAVLNEGEFVPATRLKLVKKP